MYHSSRSRFLACSRVRSAPAAGFAEISYPIAILQPGMRTSNAVTPARTHPPSRHVGIGLLGCAAALVLGATATTHYGVLVGGAMVGVGLFGFAAVTYMKDPVLALIGLWLFEVFNAPFSATFGYLSATGQAIRQGDEVLVLLFVAFTIWRVLRTSTRLPPLRFVLPGLGVGLFGLLGVIVHDVPLTVALVGTLLGLKLWIMLVVTLVLPWESRDLKRVYDTVIVVSVAVAVLGLVDFVTHGAVSRTLHTSNYNIREGTYRSGAVHSIFPNPGEYSLYMSMLFALTFSRFTQKYNKHDLILALLFAGSVMLSLRLKGFLSIAVVVVIIGVVQGAGNSRRAVAAFLVGVLLVAGAYVAEGSVITTQFSAYTSTETSARSRLYSTGTQIADENFPIGVGFGRFASYPSRLYYSPVYYQYKLARVYGLSPSYPLFIDDTSWPSVIGETGYGGLIFYGVGLIALMLATIRLLRRASAELRWLPLAGLCTTAVVLVDSLGEADIFAWLATTMLAMIIGPMFILLRSTPGAPNGRSEL